MTWHVTYNLSIYAKHHLFYNSASCTSWYVELFISRPLNTSELLNILEKPSVYIVIAKRWQDEHHIQQCASLSNGLSCLSSPVSMQGQRSIR